MTQVVSSTAPDGASLLAQPPPFAGPAVDDTPAPPSVVLAVRNQPLIVLAALASVFTLHWAAAVFIPLMVGLLFSYALSPLVDWLQGLRVPRAVSAALLIVGVLGGVGAAGYALSDDASRLIEALPQAAQKLHGSLTRLQGQPSSAPLSSMQQAATQLEQAADESNRAAPPAKGVQRVQIEKPRFDMRDHLWNGTLGLLGVLGQAGVVALTTFFLVASGDSFRRKLVRLAGPTLSSKRVTLQALNEVNAQIQRYMLVQLFTSVLVGLATWLCFAALGLEHAAVWGIAAGVLDLVPYLGGAIIAGGSALLGFMQFGTLEMALLVAGVSMAIHSLESFLLTPWLTSRAGKMSPVAIFVGVLAWGWLWGMAGLLLGVPILMMVKAVCDRVDGLKPVGEFLGN
jgi:predicted PurR-regulated permease PerM